MGRNSHCDSPEKGGRTIEYNLSPQKREKGGAKRQAFCCSTYVVGIGFLGLGGSQVAVRSHGGFIEFEEKTEHKRTFSEKKYFSSIV